MPMQWMGILNITPDSFYDGGRFLSKEEALKQAEKLIQDGATIIDIGGESTRPGSESVSVQEEIQRVLPVVEAVCKSYPVRVSIDTYKPEVALAAVKAGATIINDVTAASHSGMIEILQAYPQVDIVLMHMQGAPKTMQDNPTYPNGVVSEISEFFNKKLTQFTQAGISLNRVWLDPGIGFGKTLEDNLEILRHLYLWVGMGGNLILGTSRKTFISKISERDLNERVAVSDRLPGTLASCLYAYMQGVRVFRVHEVAAHKQAIATWKAMQNVSST